MTRLKFALSSDQLELLLAFENAKGLGHLSEMMAKDPSVVSRNLQRIAEDYPVLIKVKGRWEITPLGIQMNQQTRSYLEGQSKLVSETNEHKKPISLGLSKNSVLIVINAQKGLFDRTQEDRNNSDAEANIVQLLNLWRMKKRKIIHVKHISDNQKSIFFKYSTGADFLDIVKPLADEAVIEKTKSSAFIDTNLRDVLTQESCTDVFLVGFTANECIDATARDASAFGFTTFVASDATATFDLRDDTGKLVKADKIHKLTLLNINAFSARVITTKDILSSP